MTNQDMTFYKEKMTDGCNIKILILDPDSEAVQVYNKGRDHTNTERVIRTQLQTIRRLTEFQAKGKCEVRLLPFFLPFAIFAVDPQKETGSMIVEFRGYKIWIDQRPHVFLKAEDSPRWFSHFKQQFDRAWEDAGEHMKQKQVTVSP